MTDRVFYPAQEQTLKRAIPVLQQIKELLASGGAVADGAVTTSKLADNAVTMGKLSQEVQEAIAEGGSGYNPSLSVGRADALTGADSTAQWSTRESTGSGSATVRSVQGAAVGWNQLAPSSTYNRTGSFPMTAGAAIIAGHKLLMRATFDLLIPEAAGNTGIYVFTRGDAAAQQVNVTSVGSASGTLYSAITTVATSGTSDGTTTNAAGNAWIYTSFANDVSGTISGVQLFDLTQMFGAGNEPSTVAEFEAMYPASYYPYSAPTLKPVQISGIRSTDAQGGELDAIEWTAQTLRTAGNVADMLYSDHVDVNVGEITLGANNCTVTFTDVGTNQTRVQVNVTDWDGKSGLNVTSDQFVSGPADWSHITLGTCRATTGGFFLGLPTTVTNNTQAKAWIVEHTPKFYYELATPTTQPMSPALPMTYKVQAGGSEAIIVPEGEISAIPVLTVAEGESVADVVMDALACIAAPDGPVATENHSVGTYLTMKGKLYKVTSAIAVGESVVAGTNVSQTTVMAELIALTQ